MYVLHPNLETVQYLRSRIILLQCDQFRSEHQRALSYNCYTTSTVLINNRQLAELHFSFLVCCALLLNIELIFQNSK